MALGKPQKITRGPKTASTRSNSMSMTSLSQFPLLNHQTRKVQNSSLDNGASEIDDRSVRATSSAVNSVMISAMHKYRSDGSGLRHFRTIGSSRPRGP